MKFSKILQEMDRNMLQEIIDDQKKELDEKDKKLDELSQEIARLKSQLEEK